MLEEISVRDFALIDRLTVSFSEGFTILSGETGAGKSLLIGAIGFLLGSKADTGIIRTGAEEALVVGQFDISKNQDARNWLESHGMETDEGRIVVRRSIRSNGRSQVFIQGQPALRADLMELTSALVDLHGQHEQQSLMQPEMHRRLLDRFAGLVPTVEAYSATFESLARKKKDFESAEASSREREREMDFLDFTVKEIEAARLRRGELEELSVEERLLSQHERLFEAVEAVHHGLSEGEGEGGGVLPALRKARSGFDAAAAIDPSLDPLARRLDDAFYELEDISDSLRAYISGLRFSPERLEEVESRLSEIGKLRKKYGESTEAILARLEESKARLQALSTWEEDREGLAKDIAALEVEVLTKALAISAKRTEAARDLSAAIEKTVSVLGMSRARFIVRVARKDGEAGKAVVGPWGIDEVEFLMAPNPGEAPKPLVRIASGGELSRVALAAKSVFAAGDRASTLIFDEVDAGIGGEVAVTVGEHLEALGRSKQVLCITHLASIAARADNHYRVEKSVDGGRTVTRLVRVEGRERAGEIARMLAGDQHEEASIAHATELLRKYGNWRD
ncbi:MAG TPA: DNA repair protein RecN [Rectinemataceae bacterium]|nr:DNA repair protein RecN [Rectinemataceae bacterium]